MGLVSSACGALCRGGVTLVVSLYSLSACTRLLTSVLAAVVRASSARSSTLGTISAASTPMMTSTTMKFNEGKTGGAAVAAQLDLGRGRCKSEGPS